MAVLTVSGKSVLVDDVDVPQLSHYYWVVEKRGVMEYARGTPKGKHEGKPKKVYMHRVILGAKEGE